MRRASLALALLLGGCFDLDALTRGDLAAVRDAGSTDAGADAALGADSGVSLCVGANLLGNADLETGMLSPWGGFRTTALVESADVHGGRFALAVSGSAGEDWTVLQLLVLDVHKGDRFCASGWVRGQDPIELVVTQSSTLGGGIPGSGFISDPSILAPRWQLLTLHLIANVDSPALKIELYDPAPTGTYLVDDVVLAHED